MNNPEKILKRKAIVFVLVMMLVASLVVLFIINDTKNTRQENRSSVAGVATEKYVKYNLEYCTNLDKTKQIKIGDSISSHPEYMPWAEHLAKGSARSDWYTAGGNDPEAGDIYAKYKAYLESGKGKGGSAVIMLGTNDCTLDGVGRPGYSIENFKKNINEIITTLESYGIKPILSTFPRRASNYEVQCNEEGYNKAIQEIAYTKNIPLRDIEKASIDGNIPLDNDGLHLNSEANKNINAITSTICGISTSIDGGGGSGSNSNQVDSGSDASTQCDVAGGNTAWILNDTTAMVEAYNMAKNEGLSWILVIALSANDIAAHRDLLCDSEIKTIIRPCLEECELWEGDTFINALNALNCEIYATGHNEPQNEFDDREDFKAIASNTDTYLRAVAKKIAPLTKSMVNNKSSNVKVLSPVFDVHNPVNPSTTLSDLVHEEIGGDWQKLDGIAVNAYNVSGQTISERVSTFHSYVSKYGDIPFYITETGKLDNNLELLKSEYARITNEEFNYVEAVLFFNLFGSNPSEDFAFGKLIEEGTLQDVIGIDCFTGEKILSCELHNIDKYPGLRSCDTVGGVGNAVAASLSMAKEVINGKETWYANPIVTTKVTNFDLLAWLTNSNHYDTREVPYVGTSANQVMTYCTIDSLLHFSDGPINIDMTKKFAGEIKYVDEEGNFDINQEFRKIAYSMPNLGNAVACMVYRANNFSPDSESIFKLEPRFRTDVEVDISVHPSFDETIKDLKSLIEPDIRSYDSSTSYCFGQVSRIEATDKMSGPEIVEFENGGKTGVSFTRETMCSAIAGGVVNVGAYQSTACPYSKEELAADPSLRGKANPDAIFTMIDLPPGSGYMLTWPASDQLEISGGAQALAEIWKEEAKQFPLQGVFKMIHRDKSGITISLQRSVYDGLSGDPEKIYQRPLQGEDNKCTYQEFIRGSKPLAAGGKSTGNTKYVFPWMGQSKNIMERLTMLFTDFSDTNFIDDMKALIKDSKTKLAVESDRDYFERVEKTIMTEGLLDYPNHLFMCSDLNVVSSNLSELNTTNFDNAQKDRLEDLIGYIDSTDCIGPAMSSDPMQDWLCANDYLEPVYCQNNLVCIPVQLYENEGTGGAELIKGNLAYPYKEDTQIRISQNYIKGVHPGLDIAMPIGNPIFSVADGEVIYTKIFKGASAGEKKGAFYDEYGTFVVVDHGGFVSIYAHLNELAPLEVGQKIKMHHLLGYSGNTGNSTGPHLHLELRLTNGNCLNAGTYRLATCTVDPLSFLSREATPETVEESVQQKAECITAEGKPGYYGIDYTTGSANILDSQRPGQTYTPKTNDELEKLVLDTCPLVVNSCDAKCLEKTKNYVLALADRNIRSMANYSVPKHYSKDEISSFMDQMWQESQNTDTPFHWLVALWLSENGLNPVYKNQRTDIKSDIFGCGVYCTPPPADFREEMACVLRKLPGCSFIYEFDASKPGYYLQPYGPIATNPTFATKVLLVWDRLAEVSGFSRSRETNETCNMYVYERGDGDWDKLEKWAIPLIRNTN